MVDYIVKNVGRVSAKIEYCLQLEMQKLSEYWGVHYSVVA